MMTLQKYITIDRFFNLSPADKLSVNLIIFQCTILQVQDAFLRFHAYAGRYQVKLFLILKTLTSSYKWENTGWCCGMKPNAMAKNHVGLRKLSTNHAIPST